MGALRNRVLWGLLIVLAMSGCGGGGGGGPVCAFGFSDTCGGPINTTPPPPPSVSLTPSRQTVQVGTPAAFTAQVANMASPSYAWCRAASQSAACVALPEATGASLTLPSASLADDGARFRVTVAGSEGTATSGFVRLAVSSMPGVVYQDGEFAETDWQVDAVTSPPQSGATFSFSRAADGGNPGAHRKATYDLPTTRANSVRIFHLYTAGTYQPTSQGAIHVIDFAHDCNTTSLSFGPATIPLIEQSGRRFIATALQSGCIVNGWATRVVASIGRDEFEQVDGPACGGGESCPDFSGAAAPIRFGLVGQAETLILPSTGPAVAHFAHSLDNWKVTAWRN